jgi:simple sugar transport system ATP-binding protein
MRGGRLISTSPLAESGTDRIAREIIGGELPAPRTRSERAPGNPVLELTELSLSGRGGIVGPLDFSVRAGEIVGIAGVSGNGQSELVRALVGLDRPVSGGIRLLGKDIAHTDVPARRAAGMSYVPEDRQRVGLALGATVSENANAGRDDRAAFARSLIERFRIRVGGASALASTMSGGNTQKLVVARELARATPLLIAENPTWGVDIGAIDFIHGEIARMRDEGHAVLLVSTELDEILTLSDRILVMYSGRISGELPGRDADRDTLGRLMISTGADTLPEVA